MQNSSDTPQSYKVVGQKPLDAKIFVADHVFFLDEIANNPSMIFSFYDSMIVYISSLEKRYEWRKVNANQTIEDQRAKLLAESIVYPAGSVYEGVDYSNLAYNFYEIILKGEQGEQGPAGADGADGAQGPQGPQGSQGPQGVQGPQGIQGVPGTNGIDGTDGADGSDVGEQFLPDTLEIVKKAIVPFVIQDVVDNAGVFVHNLNIQRYLREWFSLPMATVGQSTFTSDNDINVFSKHDTTANQIDLGTINSSAVVGGASAKIYYLVDYIEINGATKPPLEPKDQIMEYTIYENANCASKNDPNATTGISDGEGNFYIPTTVYSLRTATQSNANDRVFTFGGNVFYSDAQATTPFNGQGKIYGTDDPANGLAGPSIQVVTVAVDGTITVQTTC